MTAFLDSTRLVDVIVGFPWMLQGYPQIPSTFLIGDLSGSYRV